MTFGLPQVCKLSLLVSKDMLPVKHLTPKVLVVADIDKKKIRNVVRKTCTGRRR